MGRRLVSAKYKIQKSSSKVGISQIQNPRDEKDLRGGSCGGKRSFEVDHHKVVRHFVRSEKTVPTRPSHLSRTNHRILKRSQLGTLPGPSLSWQRLLSTSSLWRSAFSSASPASPSRQPNPHSEDKLLNIANLSFTKNACCA